LNYLVALDGREEDRLVAIVLDLLVEFFDSGRVGLLTRYQGLLPQLLVVRFHQWSSPEP